MWKNKRLQNNYERIILSHFILFRKDFLPRLRGRATKLIAKDDSDTLENKC